MKQQNRHKIASLQVRKQKARAAILNELESLKVLLDDDSLSLEEYTQAEKQLNNSKPANKSVQAKPNPSSVASVDAKSELLKKSKPEPAKTSPSQSNQNLRPTVQDEDSKSLSRVSKRRQKIRAQQTAQSNQQLNLSTPTAQKNVESPQQELLPILNQVVDEKPKQQPKAPVESRQRDTQRDSALIKSGSTIFLPKTAADQLETIRTKTRNQLLEQAVSNFPTETTKEAIQEEQNLKTHANILVQDMVDEFIPVIEDVLRRRLQKEMDEYVYELIEEYQAEAELD